MILDQFGREIEIKKQPEMREIAVAAIRDRWSLYPSAGLTPHKLAEIFKEADAGDVYRQAELFEEIEEKDTHLFSQLQTRKNAVLGCDYDIQPYSESAEDKKIAEFVGDVLFGLEGLEDALLDMLDAIGKGYSMQEIIWQVDGSRVVIADLAWIHAKKAVFYERGAGNLWQKSYEVPRIMTEAEPVNGEIMPPWKLVYHRYKARSGYDTRAGILRVCAWMYLFKNYAIKDWVAFAEVFGMPLRLGKYDPGASKADKDALVAAVRSLGSDAAGIISKSTEIEFVESVKNTGTNNVYAILADFCNKEISKAILGQTATTEGTPGRLGNEDAQDAVRRDLIKADAEALSKTVRFQIIRPLVGYNFGWDKQLPWFKFTYEPAEDLQMLSNVYKNIHAINFPMTAEHISERFKIPMPEKGQTILPGPVGPMAMKKNTLAGDAHYSRMVATGARHDDEIAAALDAEMEEKRQELIRKYKKKISAVTGGRRDQALDEIEKIMLSSSGMNEAMFTASVYDVLSKHYQDLNQADIASAVEDIYRFYRLSDKSTWLGNTPPVTFTFTSDDQGVLDALQKLDRWHLSKMIENQDMQSPVMNWLKTQYFEKGEGLFGRGSRAAIKEFRNQFADQLAGLEDWQIRRIIDTSVTRMRSVADIGQAEQAGVEKLRIVAAMTERTCDWCAERNGVEIDVPVVHKEMLRQLEESPDSGAYLQIPLPPFHPNCRCRTIMVI